MKEANTIQQYHYTPDQGGADFLAALGATGNNIIVNRYAMELVGPDAALILGELLAQWCLWKERNELDSDGYFFCTEEKLSRYTGWKYTKQRSNLDILKEHGLLYTKNKGLPLKRYFKLNLEKILFLYQGRFRKDNIQGSEYQNSMGLEK